MAQIRVANKLLEEGLSDGLARVQPQPLGSGVARHHLPVDVLCRLPAESRTRDRSENLLEVVTDKVKLPEVLEGKLPQGKGSESLHCTGLFLVGQGGLPLVGGEVEQALT